MYSSKINMQLLVKNFEYEKHAENNFQNNVGAIISTV